MKKKCQMVVDFFPVIDRNSMPQTTVCSVSRTPGSELPFVMCLVDAKRRGTLLCGGLRRAQRRAVGGAAAGPAPRGAGSAARPGQVQGRRGHAVQRRRERLHRRGLQADLQGALPSPSMDPITSRDPQTTWLY
eukprot:scaffold291308_cov17-Prasinocladus_malaysianus.AAC.1